MSTWDYFFSSEGAMSDASDAMMRERLAAVEVLIREVRARVDKLSEHIHSGVIATTELSKSVAVLASKVAEMRATRPPGKTELGAAVATGAVASVTFWELVVRALVK